MPKLLKNKLLNVEKRIFRIIGPYDNELPSLLSVADTMCDRIFQSVVEIRNTRYVPFSTNAFVWRQETPAHWDDHGQERSGF